MLLFIPKMPNAEANPRRSAQRGGNQNRSLVLAGSSYEKVDTLRLGASLLELDGRLVAER